LLNRSHQVRVKPQIGALDVSQQEQWSAFQYSHSLIALCERAGYGDTCTATSDNNRVKWSFLG
jgi:hypothetical protein